MRTLIKNGTIVTSENQFKGDILIEGEKIKCVSASADAEADRVIDAEGKYVLPGGIDQHVHFSFVYKGSKVRGFETSNAAALGGTTTVIEFVNQVKDKGLIESLEEYKASDAEGIAMVDYGFHVVMTDPRPEVIEEIPKLADAGYPTMKLFMAYKGQFFHADDDAILNAMLKGKEAGVTIMVHAENADMIDVLTKQLIAEGKTGPYYHAVSRPPVVEAEATRRAIYLAELADAPLYVVHVTCKEALQEIKTKKNWQARDSKVPSSCAHLPSGLRNTERHCGKRSTGNGLTQSAPITADSITQSRSTWDTARAIPSQIFRTEHRACSTDCLCFGPVVLRQERFRQADWSICTRLCRPKQTDL